MPQPVDTVFDLGLTQRARGVGTRVDDRLLQFAQCHRRLGLAEATVVHHHVVVLAVDQDVPGLVDLEDVVADPGFRLQLDQRLAQQHAGHLRRDVVAVQRLGRVSAFVLQLAGEQRVHVDAAFRRVGDTRLRRVLAVVSTPRRPDDLRDVRARQRVLLRVVAQGLQRLDVDALRSGQLTEAERALYRVRFDVLAALLHVPDRVAEDDQLRVDV